jgi:hypothetical protein
VGKRLHQDVTYRGSLNGSSVHWPAAGISGKLTQQGILGPTTDYVDRPDCRAEDGFEPIDGPAILER